MCSGKSICCDGMRKWNAEGKHSAAKTFQDEASKKLCADVRCTDM